MTEQHEDGLSQNPKAVKARQQRAAKREKTQAALDTGGLLSQIKAMLDEQGGQIREQIAGIASRVEALEKAPSLSHKLPTTFSPERNVDAYLKGMAKEEQRDGIKQVKDLANPYLTEEGIQARDIVALRPGSERDRLYRAYAAKGGEPVPEGQLIYGQVLQYLFVAKTKQAKGKRKYKVEFKGFGKDGVLEDELILVKSAS